LRTKKITIATVCEKPAVKDKSGHTQNIYINKYIYSGLSISPLFFHTFFVKNEEEGTVLDISIPFFCQFREFSSTKTPIKRIIRVLIYPIYNLRRPTKKNVSEVCSIFCNLYNK
jgi:hypothetical protein